MPVRPLRTCRVPGCQGFGAEGYCEAHAADHARRKAERLAVADQRRGSSADRGYDSRWRKTRASYLLKHPLCVKCAAEGRTEIATVVDHIKPHRGDKALFWDKTNWQPLCNRHHAQKTATEVAGSTGWSRK